VAKPAGQPGRRRAGGFHKLMVPLLLGVAGLLLVLSALTLAKLMFASARGSGAERGPLQAHGWWLVLASCPLAAALVLTAWFLYRAARRRAGDGA
jgi:hypothetical protein